MTVSTQPPPWDRVDGIRPIRPVGNPPPGRVKGHRQRRNAANAPTPSGSPGVAVRPREERPSPSGRRVGPVGRGGPGRTALRTRRAKERSKGWSRRRRRRTAPSASGSNAVLPGTADTACVRPPGIPDAAWAQFKKAYGPLNVGGLERMAEPEEIARAILALTSDDFGYRTGASVPLDGGATAGRRMVLPPTN
ncbi:MULTISPECIES: SDR family oxidoreductase [unclassified Kitasatospora]|uniref:SDR family oxidoreductase n=1 Tax=unclassified Kitasatospora TaxID=2633591 RepID=UPI0033C6BF8C